MNDNHGFFFFKQKTAYEILALLEFIRVLFRSVVGTDGENFRSLTDAEVERYKQRFAEVEDIFPEEVQEHMGFTFFAW